MDDFASLELSLVIPAKSVDGRFVQNIERAHEVLLGIFGDAAKYEIILVPNGVREGEPILGVAKELSERFPAVRSFIHEEPAGKGAALRTGFNKARGRKVFFTDADLPYDLKFFKDALQLLDNGVALVGGNRRFSGSRFDIPVELLNIAYSRHRLGLLFNQVVRMLFPIKTRDTQAGIKGMTREFVSLAMSKQQCPGFLFDIEYFLVAIENGFKTAEVPVTLYLNTEKSTVRLFRELVLSIYWLTTIWMKFKRGHYRLGVESVRPTLNPAGA